MELIIQAAAAGTSNKNVERKESEDGERRLSRNRKCKDTFIFNKKFISFSFPDV